MRAVVQRVTQSAVVVKDETVAHIDRGLLVLLGITHTDSDADIEWLAAKISKMRIFDDEAGVMNRSVGEVAGDVIVVSQFTLHASTKKGNRPSYISAAPGTLAQPMYRKFCVVLSHMLGKPVHEGVFGAHMQVQLTNDGPVTIVIDSKNTE